MTDTPSRRLTEPSAPDAAEGTARAEAEAEAAERRAVPGQATARGRATETPSPAVQGTQPTMPQQITSAGPVAGWEWSGHWIPKPGVIPLRPLRFAELLNASFAAFRRHWRTLLIISGCTALVTQAVASTATWFGTSNAPTPTLDLDSTAGTAELLHQEIQLFRSLGPTFAISLPLTVFTATLAGALVAPVVSRAVLGRSARFAEVWPEIRACLPKALGLAAMMALGLSAVMGIFLAPAITADLTGASDRVVLSLGLLAGPGGLGVLWLYISLLLAGPALALERRSLRDAVERSLRLVRGSWWRIFALTVCVTVMVDLAASVVSSPLVLVGISTDASDATSAGFFVLAAVFGAVTSMLTIPVTSMFSALLYVDQRIRREALDLELAAAAGVPQYSH